MYNGIFCEAIWGTLPFEKLFCLFPLTRSSIDSFGELPWLYQGLTLCVQGVYPNYTSPYACLYNGCIGVSFVKQFNKFSYLNNSLSYFPQVGLPLIVLGNYHDCMKVWHHVWKECILIAQVHNGIFCEAIWGVFPFKQIFCMFLSTNRSFINSFRELL